MAKSFSIKRLPGFTTIAMITFFVLYLPIATLVRLLTEAGRKGVSGRFPPRS